MTDNERIQDLETRVATLEKLVRSLTSGSGGAPARPHAYWDEPIYRQPYPSRQIPTHMLTEQFSVRP